MSLIKAWRYLKIVVINILVFVIPLILLDVYFLYDKLDYRTVQVTCAAKLTNYNYCPSITHLRYMPLADRWLPIVNFLDENGRSTYKNKPDFSSIGRRIFLIGDSFIQADELYIEDRFEHTLRNEGYEVHAIGYSSWNSRQFNAIVKSLDLRAGDEVIVFSMGNDYTPSYNRSTIKTTLNVESDALAIPDERGLWARIYSNSLLVNTFQRSKAIVDGYIELKDKAGFALKTISFSHNEKNWEDCNSLPSVYDVASPSVHDYLSLSKHEKCWSKEIQESVALNISLLNEMTEIVQSKGANFKIVLIPAGWAFPKQNTIGRKHQLYNISVDVSVSQIGLANKLIDENFEILDLEKLLAEHAMKGVDHLYFPADGHFTKEAHRIIGKHLINTLN